MPIEFEKYMFLTVDEIFYRCPYASFSSCLEERMMAYEWNEKYDRDMLLNALDRYANTLQNR